jgi:UDP-N-acetylglucosamine 2-epimerase
MKVGVVAGTRPEFIKLAPVVTALRGAGIEVNYVHTGQHTSPGLADSWKEVPWWPAPELQAMDWQSPTPRPAWIDLPTGYRRSADHGDTDYNTELLDQLAHRMIALFAPVDAVLVQGDTWSTLVGAHAAELHGVPCIHLEAGLRCMDARVPEERIRVLVDEMADLLLTPSPLASRFAELGCKDTAQVVHVGQTGLDAMREAQNHARTIDLAGFRRKTEGPWILVTLHREEWDHRGKPGLGAQVLELYVEAIVDGAVARPDRPAVIWPVHPRWNGKLAGPAIANMRELLRYHAPVGYLNMVAQLDVHPPVLVVTDSGGLVEECYALGIPTVTLRDSTERWEVVTEMDDLLQPRRGLEALRQAVRREGLDRDLRYRRQQIEGYEAGQAYACPHSQHTASTLAAKTIGDFLHARGVT